MTERILLSDLLKDENRLSRFILEMRSGAVAAVPTDTLYGLAVDSDSAAGVSAVYDLKGRDASKPLILFLYDSADLGKLEIFPSPSQKRVLEQFWPGQLTVVFPLPAAKPENFGWNPGSHNGHRARGERGEKAFGLFGNHDFGFSTLGIRVPDHPELRRLLSVYPGHLLTTSANPSGAEPICDPDEIARAFSPGLHWLLDGGILPKSSASTVLDVSSSPPRILREGRISRIELASTGIFEAQRA